MDVVADLPADAQPAKPVQQRQGLLDDPPVGAQAGAVRVRYAAGLLPVLTSFVVILTGLCIKDLTNGAVSWPRVLSHLVLVAGLAVVVRLAWLGRARTRPDPSGDVLSAPQATDPACSFHSAGGGPAQQCARPPATRTPTA